MWLRGGSWSRQESTYAYFHAYQDIIGEFSRKQAHIILRLVILNS